MKKITVFLLLSFITLVLTGGYLGNRYITQLQKEKTSLDKKLVSTQSSLLELKNQDQYKINQQQQDEIKSIKANYKKSIDLYEQLLDLQAQKQKTTDLEKLYVQAINDLASFEYASSQSRLKDLEAGIKKLLSKFQLHLNVTGL